MNIEQAKKNIVAYIYYAIDDMPEDVGKALDVAIQSLDMWDKVIEEIKRSENHNVKNYMIRKEIIDIIEKYKKEIEE